MKPSKFIEEKSEDLNFLRLKDFNKELDFRFIDKKVLIDRLNNVDCKSFLEKEGYRNDHRLKKTLFNFIEYLITGCVKK